MSLLCKKICCCAQDGVDKRSTNEWETLLKAASANPEAVIKAHGMKRTVKACIDPWGYVCLREYNWDFKRKLEMIVRKSRGQRIWEYSPVLLEKGISVQTPLLFFEKRYAGVLVKTWLATPWLEKKIDLGSLAMDVKFRASSDFHLLVHSSVRMVARLHDADFLHGDLKWSNFLCVGNLSRIILGDLDGIRRSNSERLKVKDFARFVLSVFQYALKEELAGSLIHTYVATRQNADHDLTSLLVSNISKRREYYINKPLLPPN